jgi:phenylpyruvate tautomerase PptA (4-oxalocrotonate tautomerase family)
LVFYEQEDIMPLAQISLRRGKSPAYRQAILDGLQRALRATFGVPEGDQFMTMTEFDEDHLVFGAQYPDVRRSDDLVIMQLTVSNTRTQVQKLALYRRIVRELGEQPGLRPDDVFINLVEVLPENWSFGRGLAQNIARAAPVEEAP